MKRIVMHWVVGLALLATGSGGAVAAPNGSELFDRHCAVCHGEGGQGGVGVPLALESFLSSVSDDYLRQTIRWGRPGRIMPAFQSLSESDVEAIVGYVRGLSSAPQRAFAKARIQGDAARGGELYGQSCAACHGARGEGGHGTGVTFSRPRDLPILAPALNNPGFLASASDAMIKYTLMHGREGTPMVSFLGQGLKEGDIDDIVAYVRDFENHPLARPAATDDAPVLVAQSPYGMEETLAALKNTVTARNFRIIRQQYLEEGLLPEDMQNKKQVVLYFCNFNMLNDALAIDPRVGMFLPCRVTLLERDDGVVQLMAINPLRLSKLFNNAELDQACKDMYTVYKEVLEDATL